MVQIAAGAQERGRPTPCPVPWALLLCAILAAPASLGPPARHVLTERPPPTQQPRVSGHAAATLPRGPGAAAPTPTPVLPMGDQARRYKSSLAPYSVVTTWPGKAAVWPDGRWDQFERDGRIIEIAGDRAVPGATTAQAVQELIAYLRTTRMMELHLLGPVHVAGQHVPLFLTRYRGDWVARLWFVAAGRVWMFSLDTDGWHREADLADFLAMARSFRLDRAAA